MASSITFSEAPLKALSSARTFLLTTITDSMSLLKERVKVMRALSNQKPFTRIEA